MLHHSFLRYPPFVRLTQCTSILFLGESHSFVSKICMTEKHANIGLDFLYNVDTSSGSLIIC
jgi:hypothetical protein